MVFALVGKELIGNVTLPNEAVAIISEFQESFPEELSNGLPPLRDIQHQIDQDESH